MTPNQYQFDIARLFVLLATLIAIASASTAWGQDNADTNQEVVAEETTAAKPEAPEKVDVKPVARDEEIQERLNEILASTNRFNQPNATVENGVVFLEGEAKEDEFKGWATDLASNTQDVAAVVNRMTVVEKSIWDFSAAFAELRDFRNTTIQAIPLVIFGIVILVVTWLLAQLAGYLADSTLNKRVPNSLLRWVITRGIMLPILIFGVYLILRVSGLTQLALTVLGGTGLIGLIIGIAFQDIAENFLASILISIQKPFRINDLIRLDGHEGIVQRVTTRGTTLLTADGNHVQIPNAQVYKTTIENFTANPLRRFTFEIGIGYDDSTSEAQKVVLEKIKEHSATLNDPPPRVLIETLGASTVNLKAFVWIDGTKNDWRSVRSSCMRIAKQALLQTGISLPDEAREVIFPNGVPVMMNGQQAELPSSEPNGKPVASDDLLLPPSRIPNDDQAVSTAVQQQPTEEHSSEAEGNMQTDTADLKKQADASWLPGEGEEVLVGEELEAAPN